jgi:hypothetical protein
MKSDTEIRNDVIDELRWAAERVEGVKAEVERMVRQIRGPRCELIIS